MFPNFRVYSLPFGFVNNLRILPAKRRGKLIAQTCIWLLIVLSFLPLKNVGESAFQSKSLEIVASVKPRFHATVASFARVAVIAAKLFFCKRSDKKMSHDRGGLWGTVNGAV